MFPNWVNTDGSQSSHILPVSEPVLTCALTGIGVSAQSILTTPSTDELIYLTGDASAFRTSNPSEVVVVRASFHSFYPMQGVGGR